MTAVPAPNPFMECDYSELEMRVLDHLIAEQNLMVTNKEIVARAKGRIWRAQHRPEQFAALDINDRMGRRVAWCAIMAAERSDQVQSRATFLIGWITGYFNMQNMNPSDLADNVEAIDTVSDVIADAKAHRMFLHADDQYDYAKARGNAEQGDPWADVYLKAYSELQRCV